MRTVGKVFWYLLSSIVCVVFIVAAFPFMIWLRDKERPPTELVVDSVVDE